MAKKINPKKVKRSIKSGLNFSKFYFSKSTSVVLITTYSAVLFLALAVLGFSSLILPKSVSDDVPSLPEKEPFAFLPADNIEVPALGDVDTPEKPVEETKPEEAKPEETPTEEKTISTPEAIATQAIAEAPVTVVEKEVIKEVVKEVPKEVVKVVEKVVEKEPAKEAKQEAKKPATEEIHYDNYAAPTDYSSYLDFPDYKDYPDIEE